MEQTEVYRKVAERTGLSLEQVMFFVQNYHDSIQYGLNRKFDGPPVIAEEFTGRFKFSIRAAILFAMNDKYKNEEHLEYIYNLRDYIEKFEVMFTAKKKAAYDIMRFRKWIEERLDPDEYTNF